MFRIPDVFVDDKKLVAFLKAAAGLVYSMGVPEPVVNIQEPSKLEALSNGNLAEVYLAELYKQRIKEFSVSDTKTFLQSIGKSGTSANYALKMLKKQKKIKMTSRGNYEVIG